MLQAYKNDDKLKVKTIAAMKADIKAERLVKGSYWNNSRKNGCFVGCVIRGSAHIKFETQLGIPQVLARIADNLFERMPYEDAKVFTVNFLKAIKVGADLSGVWLKYMHAMLVDKDIGVINFTKKHNVKAAVQGVADLFKRKIDGGEVTLEEWRKARQNAAAAAAADYAAAAAAAAAYADADYAAAAAAAYADYASLRSRHFVALANLLVRLLGEAK